MACWVKTVPYMGAITHDETTAQLRQTGSARARSSTALNASMATAVVATSRPNPGMATAGAAKPPWAGGITQSILADTAPAARKENNLFLRSRF